MQHVTLDDIIDIFGELIDLSGLKIDESAVLGDDIPIDSGEMLRIISRVEAKYSFRFKPEDILGLKTLGDIVKTAQFRQGTRH